MRPGESIGCWTALAQVASDQYGRRFRWQCKCGYESVRAVAQMRRAGGAPRYPYCNHHRGSQFQWMAGSPIEWFESTTTPGALVGIEPGFGGCQAEQEPPNGWWLVTRSDGVALGRGPTLRDAYGRMAKNRLAEDLYKAAQKAGTA